MTTLLRGAQLLRPTAVGAVAEHADVLLSGEGIEAIGPPDTLSGSPPDSSLDLTGLTLLPGLIDVHTHTVDRRAMELYLRSGITSVRLAGSVPGTARRAREGLAAGALTGPRVFSCGPMLDEAPAAWPEGTIELLGPSDARRAIDAAVADGADALILGQRMREATVARVVEEAHQRQLVVTAQTWSTSGRSCVEAGIDGLENTCRLPEPRGRDVAWLESYGSVADRLSRLMTLWVEAPAGQLEELMAQMASAGVVWAPEACSFALWSGSAAPLVLASVAGGLLTADERAGLGESAARQTQGWSAADRRMAERAIERVLECIATFVGLGGTLAVGSDSRPAAPFVHLELALLRRAGLDPARILAAATVGGARALNRDDLGRLEPGATADLICVEGDPLTDLGALQRVRHAWIGGRQVVRDGELVGTVGGAAGTGSTGSAASAAERPPGGSG